MKRNITIIFTIAILALSQLPLTAMAVNPQSVDITSPDFKFVICDGPKPPPGATNIPANYVPCDFNAVIKTVQHLINIAIVVGVIVALGSFCYIGFLYLTGKEKNISLAKSILPKVFFGFIMMLSAWFIVYELLSWLGTSPGFRSLLGSA